MPHVCAYFIILILYSIYMLLLLINFEKLKNVGFKKKKKYVVNLPGIIGTNY